MAEVISLSARWWTIWRGVHSPLAELSSSSSRKSFRAATTASLPWRYLLSSSFRRSASIFFSYVDHRRRRGVEVVEKCLAHPGREVERIHRRLHMAQPRVPLAP